MKNLFREYCPPTSEELEDLWDNGLIVLDTNVLLSFFRFSADTRDEFFSFLEKEKDRIWIPNQVGLEFHRRHLGIPNDQEKMLAKVKDAIDRSEEEIRASISDLRRYAKPIADELSTAVAKSMKKLQKKTDRILEAHKAAVISEDARQSTLERITDLYDGRVGEPYLEEKLADIEKSGKNRYAKEIPPGYKDAAKKENQYGDLIVWLQMLDKAETEGLPMIFVTADLKEDWWWQVKGKTVSARPELIKEYYEISGGKRIHFYDPDRFLKFAKEKGEAISDATVEEVEGFSLSSERNTVRDRAHVPLRGDINSFMENLKRAQVLHGPRLGTDGSVGEMARAFSQIRGTVPEISDHLKPLLRTKQDNWDTLFAEILGLYPSLGIMARVEDPWTRALKGVADTEGKHLARDWGFSHADFPDTRALSEESVAEDDSGSSIAENDEDD